MIYLLKDGRIINSKDYGFKSFWITDDNYLFVDYDKKTNLGEIEAKSENLLDLARAGDCVETHYDGNDYTTISFIRENDIEAQQFIESNGVISIDYEDVIALWKLSADGKTLTRYEVKTNE